MGMKIEGEFLIMSTVNGMMTISITEQDMLSIDVELIKNPKINTRYSIQNGIFEQDNSGDWYCEKIYLKKNTDKKTLEFWKPDSVPARVSMVRRRV